MNFIICGKTGVGKSKIIEMLTGEKGISNDELKSFTEEIKHYKYKKNHKIYDTPGLGDSSGRDQVFISKTVDILSAANTGIHQIILCIPIYESRFDQSLQLSMFVVLEMFNFPDPELFSICLTKNDIEDDIEGTKAKWDKYLKGFINNLNEGEFVEKTKKYRNGFNIISCGKNDMKEIEELFGNCNQEKYVQTKLMKHVQTLESKARALEEEIKGAGAQIEQLNLEKQFMEIQNKNEKDEKKILQNELQMMILENKKKELQIVTENNKLKQVELENKGLKSRNELLQKKQQQYANSGGGGSRGICNIL